MRIELSYTNRDEESLNRYLGDIAKIVMINAEEEAALARKIKTGDQAALDKLVKANLRFVVSVSKKYRGLGLSLNDMINEGNLGLIRAASQFDETKGFKFISYAVWWIRQSILMAISEQKRTIRIPMNHIIAQQKISQHFTTLEQSLEREPTPEELAQAMEIHVDVLTDHLWHGKPTQSLNAKISEGDDLEFSGIIADPNSTSPDEEILKESSRTEAIRLLNTLPKREQKIMCDLFGLNGEGALTMIEVANKNDLSKERIRQLKTAALKKMRQHLPERLMEQL